MGKTRHIITAIVFLIAMFGFVILNRVISPPDVSQSERRPLAKFPELTGQTLVNGKFMGDFEGFAADSFVLRDGFRSIRAGLVFDVFRQTDKSGLYYGDTGAGKFESIKESEYRLSARKFVKLQDSMLSDLNVYWSIVPDKSEYAGRYLPGFDLARALEILSPELSGMTYIDVANALDASDYYSTDLHWDQSRLGGVVDALTTGLSATGQSQTWETRTAGEFRGVYAGQLARNIPPDVMTYTITPAITGANAQYLSPTSGALEHGDIYDLEAFGGGDPYDLFLKGAQPLIVLENPTATTARELYMFRDSFSSSLAPLLLGYYSRITLIDLRYIDSRALPNYVEFTKGADALFIYSSQILNNSTVLNVG
jgi:hypothetical protein